MPGKRRCWAPTSKSQVTLQYADGKPVRATKIVVSIQHSDRIEQDEVREIVRPYVALDPAAGWMCDEEHFLVNPTGRFVIGGPDGDAGVTGRKIIVDTYGGAAPHGGGAFSGKDPTKVDRSGRLCRALSRQERRRRGARRALHDPGRLCDRRRQAAVVLCRYRRSGGRAKARRGAAGADGSVAARHPHPSRPEQADLHAHRRLRPFRPHSPIPMAASPGRGWTW